MTDSSTLDEYNRRQEEARTPIQKMLRATYLPMFTQMSSALLGYDPPTPEEILHWKDHEDKKRIFWTDQYALAIERTTLNGQQTTVLENVLKLHAPVNSKCEGCDMEGMEAESPEWPCRTISVAVGRPSNFYVRF